MDDWKSINHKQQKHFFELPKIDHVFCTNLLFFRKQLLSHGHISTEALGWLEPQEFQLYQRTCWYKSPYVEKVDGFH